ncbi:peptidoglycan D,D-transpeptidase FtsI family protein [Gulosibacter chungangensis]|uniref:Penicillin-binding protein 2 n=1 Tax=Gulosibacter chungangensis TaxID=979746 RepID=A0A7J5BCP2_9MICO|nr:penicillin-binding protein 2 [Gulosibacter chungangensis]KAB1643977.1 penicillin-binding protein 2 [Gulosibacter chungangensis]
MAKPRKANVRAILPMFAVAIVVVVFIGRLVSLQVLDAAAINSEADGRRGVVQTLWGTRGSIVDTNGAVLASSVDRFDITFAPVNMSDYPVIDPETDQEVTVTVEESLQKIAEITDQDPAELQTSVDAIIAGDPESQFGYLARMVTLEEFQQVRELRIPWVYDERHPERVYPNGAVGGSITGFLGSDGTPLAGLELQYDQCLAGANGQETYIRSRDNVAIPGSIVTLTEPTNGGTLQTTLDLDTDYMMRQILAENVEAMEAKYGTITVVEVETGEILSAAEYPAVDPNDPSSVDAEYRGSLTFTAPYEPGSIMKPITAAYTYDKGAIDPFETITVPDTWPGSEANFSDDSPHDPEEMNLNGVMAQSSNVGIVLYGQRVDAASRYQYLLDFGFANQTDVGFIGEESGILYEPEQWDSHTALSIMFGQGISVTAAQMASAYQTIANGGTSESLKLVKGCLQEDGELTDVPESSSNQVISADAAALTLQALEATAQDSWLADEVAIPGYRVGMKTGTAQVVNPETGLYEENSYITSMAGVAPIDDPKYVVIVTLANPVKITTSAATASAWQQAMSYMLTSNDIAPSPTPWPQITIEP